MSLANPLPLAAFVDTFLISDVKFYPQWMQQMSGSGGGLTLYADRAPMLWLADITTINLKHADAEAVMALINSRAGGLKNFLLYNPKVPYPSSDPTGSIFGAATPIVNVVTDAFHLSFSGFPAGYVMPVGAYFQAVFGSSYYLGQFAEAKTADGSGAISAVEVTPALPASIAHGNAVTVKKPAALFKIALNTAFPSTTSPLYSRVSFSARQTY